MTNVVCIIQARMGSTRLPGKVLKKIGKREVLWHVYQRVKKAKKISSIVVATSTEKIDDQIYSYCQENDFTCFRGSESDVLDRFYQAAKMYNADVVVRITADCPLIDPQIIDAMLTEYKHEYDYYSNCHPLRTVPVGLDVEIVSFKALALIHKLAELEYQRQHVTAYLYQHPEQFKVENYINSPNAAQIRVTLDTPEDYDLIQKIYASFPEEHLILLKDIIKFCKRND